MLTLKSYINGPFFPSSVFTDRKMKTQHFAAFRVRIQESKSTANGPNI